MTTLSTLSTFPQLQQAATHGDKNAVELAKSKLQEAEHAFTMLRDNGGLPEDVKEHQEVFMWAAESSAKVAEAYNLFQSDRDHKTLMRHRAQASQVHKITGLKTKYTPNGVLAFIIDDPKWKNYSFAVTIHTPRATAPSLTKLHGDTLCQELPSTSDEFKVQMQTNIETNISTIHIYRA